LRPIASAFNQINRPPDRFIFFPEPPNKQIPS
jgi:hypothetical protein